MARIIKRIALLLLAILLLLVLAGWWLMRGSLPALDGELALPGLSAPVTVTRDALGVVTIDAANATDAARALGYVHAQERYFEMDLMRRTAAGELAALFGPIAVDTDREHRVHRLRERTREQLSLIAGDQMPQLRAYVDGANAGLATLRTRPWPYLLLRQQPQPWRLEDSPLVGDAMYFDLQGAQAEHERALWTLRPHLPPALFALLARDGTSWDAPLQGEARGDAVLPGADEVDLRKLPMPAAAEDKVAMIESQSADLYPGSNNFAVAGSATTDGRAIVANDMHLGLRAPNLWFRARLRYPDPRAPGGRVDVQGVTLPGLPLVVVGSNGHVAWGFTNSYMDSSDWAEQHACAPTQTPANDGCTNVTWHRERIEVAGAKPVDFDVEETTWGPVLAKDADGRLLALRWSAQLPGALRFDIGDIARARNLDEAFAIADHAAIPTQNLMLADSGGRIGWRLFGPIPQRAATCIADGENIGNACPPWSLRSDVAPRVVDPPSGRLWTANARTLDGADLARVGNGGYALGARAQQIRDDLLAKPRLGERDLLAIQLDDRALFLQRWWQLLRDESAAAKTPALRALTDAATKWDGRADTASTSYRIVRAWHRAVNARLLDGLTTPAQAALGKDFVMPDVPQFEGVAWPLVTQRPMNLLPRKFASWDALFEDAAVEVRDTLAKDGPLAQRTWGERNTARICHPLSMALPGFAKRLLCMPYDQLDGDTDMPRVAAPDFGASERMVVSPGHEADGILHMPGGQSGNPLSPFWGAGHEAWVKGEPTPFLPGPVRYTLKLEPEGR
ncbi:penicillin acylase family protein [Pseudoluteimonas lycopersici]|uniref:Penicillin acylase family protein n=1 Tax=Pseudoluteimonas lycopersici TaxID=1324796 RepID=A0A516V3Y9_9GAMM|nr:penicillin acylase family protein [Lysobacter lycopersici]QDQ73252.1 penicillin acylase family protein [Lysobacter lycopersici]